MFAPEHSYEASRRTLCDEVAGLGYGLLRKCAVAGTRTTHLRNTKRGPASTFVTIVAAAPNPHSLLLGRAQPLGFDR